MGTKTKATLLWISTASLLLASAWFLNLAMYHWFAADFHNEYSHAHDSWGNVFVLLAIALCGAFVGIVVAVFRRRNRRSAQAQPIKVTEASLGGKN
jgi:H+/Cl- antiporter ClcA